MPLPLLHQQERVSPTDVTKASPHDRRPIGIFRMEVLTAVRTPEGCSQVQEYCAMADEELALGIDGGDLLQSSARPTKGPSPMMARSMVRQRRR